MLLEISLILRRIQRNIIKNVHRFSCKVLDILSDLNKYWNFLDRYSKNTQISNLIIILLVRSVFLHADIRTDRQACRQTEYVILVAFTLQQRLLKRSSALRCTYIASLVKYNSDYLSSWKRRNIHGMFNLFLRYLKPTWQSNPGQRMNAHHTGHYETRKLLPRRHVVVMWLYLINWYLGSSPCGPNEPRP